ncbi:unnamed protein product [Caenorhabditis auriculariae]|uniref:Uncharacterized protein n=1 Tax=Caenorhabditis auriculariae TaxID=2777116 RepID=A0A8S1HRU3_9PELO|nr:unnamed protein product [Caenorhabditis auriculariae]
MEGRWFPAGPQIWSLTVTQITQWVKWSFPFSGKKERSLEFDRRALRQPEPASIECRQLLARSQMLQKLSGDPNHAMGQALISIFMRVARAGRVARAVLESHAYFFMKNEVGCES